MAIAPPASRREAFLDSSGPYDVGLAVVATWAIWPRLADAYWDGSWARVAGYVVVLAAIVGLNAGKTYRAFIEKLRKAEPHELEGCLHTLETILLGEDIEPTRRASAGLRLTIHIPIDGSSLVQICDYVGDQRTPNARGRKFPQNSGVAGQAFRDASIPGKAPALHLGSRTSQSQDDFIKQMVSDYAFTVDAARKLNAGTMSWMAYPIVANGALQGVLYCDSKQPNFFTESRQQDIVNAMAGFAYFVGRRYN